MKVLIADDDPMALKLLERILSTEPSYEIERATDGQECWELLKGGYRPDVCLLDIEMPRLSGLDLLERMRTTEEFQAIPVLIITARSDIDSQASAAALRSFAFIVKPFNPKRVLSLVAEASVSSGKSFEPDGFEPQKDILKLREITAAQYFKQMVYFVGMLAHRIEILGAQVSRGRWREINATIKPLRSMSEFIGAKSFVDYFDKIEKSTAQDSSDAVACAQQHYRRLRSDFDDLRLMLEARLNVIIKTGATDRIATVPLIAIPGESVEGLQLTAEIEEREIVAAKVGFPAVSQFITLRAKRGEVELATARFEIENGQIVLRSTIDGALSLTKRNFDIAIFPENQLEKSIRVTRPKETAASAGRTAEAV